MCQQSLPRATFARREGIIAEIEVASFAVRWARKLPIRWARNGAVVAGLMSLGKYGNSESLRYVFQNLYLLISLITEVALSVGLFTLIGFLLGLWARRSISPINENNLATNVKTIPRRWITGAIVLGILVMLSDVVFEWRGQQFVSGGTPKAIGENIGYIGGAMLVCVTVGLITGYVSRQGLKKALKDDNLRLSDSR